MFLPYTKNSSQTHCDVTTFMTSCALETSRKVERTQKKESNQQQATNQLRGSHILFELSTRSLSRSFHFHSPSFYFCLPLPLPTPWWFHTHQPTATQTPSSNAARSSTYTPSFYHRLFQLLFHLSSNTICMVQWGLKE